MGIAVIAEHCKNCR